MAQIKDTNVIKTPEVVINPVLFVPSDVVDVRGGTTEITQDDIPSDEIDIFAEYDVSGDTGAEQSLDSLTTPQLLSIVSQTVKAAPDGRSLVDVVVEVEDVPGALDYDVRMTKV